MLEEEEEEVAVACSVIDVSSIPSIDHPLPGFFIHALHFSRCLQHSTPSSKMLQKSLSSREELFLPFNKPCLPPILSIIPSSPHPFKKECIIALPGHCCGSWIYISVCIQACVRLLTGATYVARFLTSSSFSAAVLNWPEFHLLSKTNKR
jgi:hypothetical protein